VDAVLSALAACTAVDVVDILEKRRTPLDDLAIGRHRRPGNDHPRVDSSGCASPTA
jgi:uncharacterized OsmC-like protein